MLLLTLIRHAKASWDDPALADFDRPLNARGERDAMRMAAHLRGALGAPDRIISSPALRALTTARIFADALAAPAARFEQRARIYEASVETLLTLVQLLDDADRHSMLFGHNPGFTELAHRLARCSFDDMPTCAVVQIGFDVRHWSDVAERSGTQRFYAFPRQFREKS